MQIKNPTKDLIEVTIKGTRYSIQPESILENVPEEHARYWQENLHKFLELKKDKVIAIEVPEIPEAPAPLEETIEVVEQEVIDEVAAPETEVTEEVVEVSTETPVVKPSNKKKK